MTSKRRVPLDALAEGQLAILREEVNDWLVAKSDDLPHEIGDADAAKREVEEVAALGRLVSGLRRGEILVPDPVARELLARTTSETRDLDGLKEEYDRELARHKAWLALLAHFEEAPPAGPGAAVAEALENGGGADEDPEPSSDAGDPGPPAARWVGLAGRLSDDQLRIVRKEVTGSLAGKAGDLPLLQKERDPERAVAEIAALARLAFWLERGEVEVPDRIVHEMVVGLATASDDLNEEEELRRRHERGVAEHDALLSLAAVFSDASPR